MPNVKLSFTTYDNPSCSGLPKTAPIYAIFNPKDYTRTFKNNYKNSDKQGGAFGLKLFEGAEPESFSLKDLIIDTSIIPFGNLIGLGVGDYVENLKKAIYSYIGDSHMPNFVKVTWGNMVFKGLCTSFIVNYTLFDIIGLPLRAKLSLDFESSVDTATGNALASTSSPDLTHSRTVKAGDTLSIMSNNIYKDSSYYLELARTNNLNSVFDIKPGDQIFFPPIKK